MRKIFIFFILSTFCLISLIILNCQANNPIIDDENGQTSSYSASSFANTEPLADDVKIIFLHHSTGGNIWGGGVSGWFTTYNTTSSKSYQITERAYPKSTPYGWNNYPYDYWNIWVNHQGYSQYLQEDTIELLASAPQNYKVIIWKHCFPVSGISADTGSPSISSDYKTIENYQLQYNALKTKMRQFSDVRFIVWTGAALVAGATNLQSAQKALDFFNWVKNTWDEPDDNIFVWDFYALETEGTLYFLNDYAEGTTDSHPDAEFSAAVAPYFCHRIIDIIQGRGDSHIITGTDGIY